MTALRVWAPLASEVALALGDERRLMRPEEGGWWTGSWDDVGPGTDYGFALDGAEPLPDPRSPRQPDGVHGPSRLVDHGAFAWSDDGWSAPDLRDGVVYELHVGTFNAAGTFDGAIERLDHLVELGVTHVEVMPVNTFPGARGWGYDGVGLYAPQESYGGPDGLKRLVDACHARGIAVLLDVVYNHFGPDGNHLPRFGPYLTDRYLTPWGDAVNLDGPGSDEVRRFIVDNALGWLRDYHVDGLRLDAVHAFHDRSAVHLLEQLAAEVAALERELGRRLVLVAESDLNDPRLLWPVERGGYGLDASWNDDAHHAIHVALTGEREGYYADFAGLPDLVAAFERIHVFDGRYAPSRGRRHGRPVEDVAPDRYVAFAQNHDQVGNRALGERLSQLVEPDALRVAATLVLGGPFVPLLFAGEEWGAATPFRYFTDHRDPELGRAVSEGRRHEFEAFGWPADAVPDPQDPATFEASRLDWSEPGRSPHRELLDWHRRLIDLRRSVEGLRDGRRPAVRADPAAGWIVLARTGAWVAANLGETAARVTLDPAPWAARGAARKLAAGSRDDVRLAADGTLELPPTSAAIVLAGGSGKE